MGPILYPIIQEAEQLGAARDNLEHGRGGAGGRRLLLRREDERHLRQRVIKVDQNFFIND